MSYQQYPGGYGGPGGQPPPQNQYGYPPPNYAQPQGAPPVPPHPSGFPPVQSQGSYYQPGGSANNYFDPNSAPPPPGPYGQGYAPSPQPNYPQPDYRNNRASYPQQPQNGGYGAYPPNQQGPGGYGPPPPQQQPFGGYGGPPNAPYGAPPPGPYNNSQYPPQNRPQFPGQFQPGFGVPSPGYEEPPQCNPMQYGQQADTLRKAMKGLGTDEATLIRVLAQLQTPFAIYSVQRAFSQRHGRELLTDLKKETSGHFRETLLSVARGPLLEEVHAVHDAIHRPGTTESVLNDVLLCRSPPDLDAIKKAYTRTFSRDLEADVRGDLSMKTESMFVFALGNKRADESAPVDIAQAEKDAYNIQMAMEGVGTSGISGVFGGAHQEAVYSTILLKNDAQIGAIAHSYERLYNRRLDVMIEKKFSGHMQQALLYAIRGGTDKALRDAVLLEDAMKGLGTRDSVLIHRIVKYRWNKAHFDNVKRAYRETYRRNLEDRVHGETSGDYRKFLTALIMS
ncbi:hypothetical protein TWF788_006157 [Orbilia oligospora]|uniref:Annexin n=1 Tax=Orbilia oligospora TaxID=2813651 RepID=A0A6G1MA83_ORBOL|nr:hypothetical protein TWF788_006157 [Orbilia oligospora]KAF3207455.1 hypothetical protein TWF191_001032 [Orbilia oligospora]KAF3218942.1 hypothetical protein TWF679_000354 [Orbilia oligospora]KAF3251377.1 hypothetical protein TWF192_004873 [Orbilia oligospora]